MINNLGLAVIPDSELSQVYGGGGAYDPNAKWFNSTMAGKSGFNWGSLGSDVASGAITGGMAGAVVGATSGQMGKCIASGALAGGLTGGMTNCIGQIGNAFLVTPGPNLSNPQVYCQFGRMQPTYRAAYM